MKRVALLLSCVAAASWGAGQTYASVGRMLTLEELMETTITVSTGTQKKVAEAPSIATVITSEQIERLSATTLAEVLESIPGLFVHPRRFISILRQYRYSRSSYDLWGAGCFASQRHLHKTYAKRQYMVTI